MCSSVNSILFSNHRISLNCVVSANTSKLWVIWSVVFHVFLCAPKLGNTYYVLMNRAHVRFVELIKLRATGYRTSNPLTHSLTHPIDPLLFSMLFGFIQFIVIIIDTRMAMEVLPVATYYFKVQTLIRIFAAKYKLWQRINLCSVDSISSAEHKRTQRTHTDSHIIIIIIHKSTYIRPHDFHSHSLFELHVPLPLPILSVYVHRKMICHSTIFNLTRFVYMAHLSLRVSRTQCGKLIIVSWLPHNVLVSRSSGARETKKNRKPILNSKGGC